MQKVKAFTIAEILLVVVILGIIAMFVINIVNGEKNLQKEFIARYEMIVPKLHDIAAVAAQSSDFNEDWWADSNSLSELDCNSNNKSECLRQAFLSASSTLSPIEVSYENDCNSSVSNCISNIKNIKCAITKIFGSVGGLDLNDISFAKMPGDATIGFIYNDPSCKTMFPVGTNRRIQGCGLVLIDVNGEDQPNMIAVPEAKTITQGDEEEKCTESDFGDRFFAVVTKNGVEQSNIMINTAAGCADGETYTNGSCEPTPACPLSDEVFKYNEKLTENNDDENLTYYYPLGEDVDKCFSIRCKVGAPDVNNVCPTACGTGQKKLGGLYPDEGGNLSTDKEKECCKLIKNATDLAAMSDETYCLTGDITLPATANEGNWTPIDFNGKLYGNGYKISNVIIKDNTNPEKSWFSGFFNTCSNATIEDLELENIDYTFTGKYTTSVRDAFGGICGKATSTTMKNVAVSGEINIPIEYQRGTSTGEDTFKLVGGILGYGNNTTINNAFNSTQINFSRPYVSNMYTNIGGITGLGSTIKNSLNTGTIKIINGTTERIWGYLGGIAGGNSSISNSVNIGNFETQLTSNSSLATLYIGGISPLATSISNSNTSGAISYSTAKKNPNIHYGPCADKSPTNATFAGILTSSIGTAYDNTTTITGSIYTPLNDSQMWLYDNDDGKKPVLRWQCEPYRRGGKNCCKPTGATWETKVDVCS